MLFEIVCLLLHLLAVRCLVDALEEGGQHGE
jgi:hypothetical protein